MKENFDKWLENFSEEEQEEITDMLCESQEGDKIVFLGFSNNEDVADAYFENECENLAYLRKMKDNYILFADEGIVPTMVFNNLQEAETELKKLENSLYPSIEKQIEKFENEIGKYMDRIDIRVKAESNNNGHFYSFDIRLDGYLLEDGIFELDAEDIIEDIKTYDGLKEEIRKKYKIDIISIRKKRDNFERYYIFELEKGHDYITKEIHIPNILQGKSRKISDFIKLLDMNEILEQLEEERIDRKH